MIAYLNGTQCPINNKHYVSSIQVDKQNTRLATQVNVKESKDLEKRLNPHLNLAAIPLKQDSLSLLKSVLQAQELNFQSRLRKKSLNDELNRF